MAVAAEPPRCPAYGAIAPRPAVSQQAGQAPAPVGPQLSAIAQYPVLVRSYCWFNSSFKRRFPSDTCHLGVPVLIPSIAPISLWEYPSMIKRLITIRVAG